MSVDDRLRGALREQADSYVPPVEASLEAVRSRGRRAARRKVLGVATSVAAVGFLVAAAWGQLVDRPTAPGPAENPTATPSNAEDDVVGPLRGLITAQVAAPKALAGRWALQLNGNGTMDVEAPADFPGSTAGALFTADGTTVRTTVLGEDVCVGQGTGIYEWLAVAERVELTVVSDPCRARVRFFEEPVWTWSTDAAARR